MAGRICTIEISTDAPSASAPAGASQRRWGSVSAYTTTHVQNATQMNGNPARKQKAEAKTTFQSGRQSRERAAWSIPHRASGNQAVRTSRPDAATRSTGSR